MDGASSVAMVAISWTIHTKCLCVLSVAISNALLASSSVLDLRLDATSIVRTVFLLNPNWASVWVQDHVQDEISVCRIPSPNLRTIDQHDNFVYLTYKLDGFHNIDSNKWDQEYINMYSWWDCSLLVATAAVLQHHKQISRSMKKIGFGQLRITTYTIRQRLKHTC